MDDLATLILEEFEEFLDRNNISIPCKNKEEQKDREYNMERERLYGTEYYELLESVGNVIDNYDEIIEERIRAERCYECTGYGDDWYIGDDGELESRCDDCPFNGINSDC